MTYGHMVSCAIICTYGIMCHRLPRGRGSVKKFQNLFHWRNNLASLRQYTIDYIWGNCTKVVLVQKKDPGRESQPVLFSPCCQLYDCSPSALLKLTPHQGPSWVLLTQDIFPSLVNDLGIFTYHHELTLTLRREVSPQAWPHFHVAILPVYCHLPYMHVYHYA